MSKALKNYVLIGAVFVLLSASFTVLAQTTTSSAEKLKEGSGAAPQSPPSPSVLNKEQVKDLTDVVGGLAGANQNPSAAADPFLQRFEQLEKKVSVLEKSNYILIAIITLLLCSHLYFIIRALRKRKEE